MLSVLKRNLFLKVFSLVLAIALWLVISRGSGVGGMEMSLGIPLELHNLPKDMEVVRSPTERINVRFSGPRRIVLKISQSGISVPLDLTDAVEGETTFELYPSHIKAPEKVSVTRISPSSVTVTLERMIERRLPVDPDVQGKPAWGFRVGKVTVEPETVVVKGPRSAIRASKSVKTEPLTIEGAVQDLEEETGLVLSGGGIRIDGDQVVRVRISILPVKGK